MFEYLQIQLTVLVPDDGVWVCLAGSMPQATVKAEVSRQMAPSLLHFNFATTEESIRCNMLDSLTLQTIAV